MTAMTCNEYLNRGTGRVASAQNNNPFGNYQQQNSAERQNSNVGHMMYSNFNNPSTHYNPHQQKQMVDTAQHHPASGMAPFIRNKTRGQSRETNSNRVGSGQQDPFAMPRASYWNNPRGNSHAPPQQ